MLNETFWVIFKHCCVDDVDFSDVVPSLVLYYESCICYDLFSCHAFAYMFCVCFDIPRYSSKKHKKSVK